MYDGLGELIRETRDPALADFEQTTVISPADIEFCRKICDNRLIVPGRKGKYS